MSRLVRHRVGFGVICVGLLANGAVLLVDGFFWSMVLSCTALSLVLFGWWYGNGFARRR